MTPVVELELRATTGQHTKACVVPKGVLIQLRHNLKVPSIPLCADNTNNDDQIYHLVKITNVDGEYVKEIIDTKTEVASDYFGSKRLEGKPLCNLVWVAIRQASNIFVPPRQIIVTRHWQTCAHSASKLSVWACCSCAHEDRFKKLIGQGQRKTDAVTEVPVGPKDELVIRVKGGEGEWFQLQETVTNLKFCKFNGAFPLGHMKPSFNCACANEPCKRPRDLEISFTKALSQKSKASTSQSQRRLGISTYVGVGFVTVATGFFMSLGLPFISGAAILIFIGIALDGLESQEDAAVTELPSDCSLDLGCDCPECPGDYFLSGCPSFSGDHFEW